MTLGIVNNLDNLRKNRPPGETGGEIELATDDLFNGIAEGECRLNIPITEPEPIEREAAGYTGILTGGAEKIEMRFLDERVAAEFRTEDDPFGYRYVLMPMKV